MSKASKSRRKARTRSSSKPGAPAKRSVAQVGPVARGSSVRPSPAVPALVVASAPPTNPAPAQLAPPPEAPTSVAVSSRTSVEEAFFRSGHELLAGRATDGDEALELGASRHAQPRAVARRAQLRRVFAGVMGFASVLTVVVTAKALARHAHAASAPMDTSLTVPHSVVASIDLDAPPAEGTTTQDDKTATPPTTPIEFNASRARRQPTW